MKRALENWGDAFFDYTEGLPTPALFRTWSAITCVAGALERKTWVHTYGSNLYPSMYTIFVAPPGVGKTILTSRVQELWGELEGHHLAASSVTKASLIDDLKDATRTITRPRANPPTVTFNSLKIAANELGVLIPQYDNDFMNTLTDIYDGHGYSERRRTKDTNFRIAAPQINLLAATTPSYLKDILPEGAWDQGFLSRTILVYSGNKILRPLFDVAGDDKELFKKLKGDLRQIGNLYGQIIFSGEAAKAISTWHMGGGKPAPDHPKLHNYLTRRTTHVLKLCQVACVMDSNELVVTLDHYRQAIEWLVEVEHYMPDIFKSMATGGDARAMEECWHFVFKLYARTENKKPVTQAKVYQFLGERVPAHSVERIIDIMKKARLLEEVQVKGLGPAYVPRANRDY